MEKRSEVARSALAACTHKNSMTLHLCVDRLPLEISQVISSLSGNNTGFLRDIDIFLRYKTRAQNAFARKYRAMVVLF